MPERPSRARLLVGGAVALTLTCSGLVAGSSASAEPVTPGGGLGPALAPAAEELPTPFEEAGGSEWTTFEESVAFYRELTTASQRVSVRTIGRSVERRPLQLVAVGEPGPKSQQEAAEGSVAFFVCSVHGDEPSGRESCMALARDLALSTDAAVADFLEGTTVLFINANPDGWVADTRQNAQDVDVNRDYLALETPEARAVVDVIREWKPDILNDLHEYGPREYYETDLLHLWPRNRNVDDELRDLAQEMSAEHAAGRVTAEGYTAGVYGQLVKDGEPFLQVAGDDQGRILRNYAGLVNVVGMLSETANDPLDEAEEADESLMNRRRVEVNYLSALGSLELVQEDPQRLAEATAAAAERQTTAGAEQSGVIYFGGQDDMIPTDPDLVEPEPMCGYQLDDDQVRSLGRTLARHGIEVTRTEDGDRVVELAQPTRGLIPLLLDERSQYRLTEATPLATC
ncbi:M14 family zinc carboxypeptidase [Desertihabitans aurantiacus]|uniref:M14 family zinc carboxypeptidase n=1 Tax=Desertihabitans aurantiacus TaxID=2282477 RepID=UPI000DF831C7|nr:M14 family zinc carboxypeptidase [Desertihabitans aurantiacus]